METKEQFLSAIEKCRNALLLIHIYEEAVDGCVTMNSVLCSVAAKYPQVKLARVKSSVLKTSATFVSFDQWLKSFLLAYQLGLIHLESFEPSITVKFSVNSCWCYKYQKMRLL